MFNFEEVKDISVMKPELRKENCKFTGCVRNQDESVTFNFVDATGAKLGHREFVPKRGENQSEEDFKKNISLGVSRIAHIARAFMTEEEFKSVKVDEPNNLSKAKENWMSITRQVGGFFKKYLEAGKDATCALKVVYRKQTKDGAVAYYSSLPQVPAFISTKNHPKDFVENPQYDSFFIPRVNPDAETSAPQQGGGAPSNQTSNQTNAFSGQAASSGSEDF